MSVPVTIPNTAAYEEHVFADGEVDFVVGFIRHGDYLFGTTLSGNKMMRLDRNNLATNTVLDFGGAPLHIRGWDLVYVPGSSAALDRVYVVFANDTNLTISSVNPNPTPMTFTDVITEAGGQGQASITTDGTYLYVVRYPDAASSDTIIYRYTLDGSFTKTTLTLTGYREPMCIRAHGGFVYVSGSQTDSSATTSWLAKVNTTTFLLDTATRFQRGVGPTGTINDIAITPMHIWVRDDVGKVQKCLISNITSFVIIDTGFASNCTAVAPDGAYCWAVFENGKAVRINTTTDEQRVYTLNPGQNYFGNIALDNENIYAVRHETGTVVSRYDIAVEPGAFHWVKVTPSSTSQEALIAVASDPSGNICAHGNVNGNSLYTCKYAPDGTKLWEVNHGVLGNAHGIAAHTDGSVYIVGEFLGTANFGGDPLTGWLSSYSIYIVKLRASDGAHLWSKKIRSASSQNSNFGYAIAVDSSGNAVITGDCISPDFGNGPVAGDGIFASKHAAADGAFLWGEVFGGAGEGLGIGVDSANNIWLTGYFTFSVDFGGGAITTPAFAIFVAKLDPDSNYLWADKFGAWSSTDTNIGAKALAVTANDNVILCGGFVQTLNFGGGNMVNSSSNVPDAFFARLANDGSYVWQKHAPGTFHQLGQGCGSDNAGNMVFAGLNSEGNYGGEANKPGQAFIAKYSAAGEYLWDKTYPTLQGTRAACCDPSGNVAVCGSWRGTVDFGDGDRISNGTAVDLYLLKLGP